MNIHYGSSSSERYFSAEYTTDRTFDIERTQKYHNEENYRVERGLEKGNYNRKYTYDETYTYYDYFKDGPAKFEIRIGY